MSTTGARTHSGAIALILAWVWTGLAGLAGAVILSRPGQTLTGVLFLLSAIIACPFCVSLLQKQSGAKLAGGLQLALVLLFAGLAGLGIAQNPATLPATLKSWLPHSFTQAPLPAKMLVEASGDFGNLTTKPFTPQGANWTLEWSFDCAGLGDSGNFNAKVARTGGSVLASVEKIGDRDSGAEHYHQAGTFFLQVTSECKWSVRVEG